MEGGLEETRNVEVGTGSGLWRYPKNIKVGVGEYLYMGGNSMLSGGGREVNEGLGSDSVHWTLRFTSLRFCTSMLSCPSTGPLGVLSLGVVPSVESHGRSTLGNIIVCGSLRGRITPNPGLGWDRNLEDLVGRRGRC